MDTQDRDCFCCSQEQWCESAYDCATCPYDGPYDGALGKSEQDR